LGLGLGVRLLDLGAVDPASLRSVGDATGPAVWCDGVGRAPYYLHHV
jgi:hypothetical protein